MEADTILVNGKIYTQSPERGFCEAIALRKDEVIAVGKQTEIKRLLIKNGQRVDLEGALVIPGLVDAHVHLMSYGAFLQAVDLNPATSAGDAVRLIGEKTAGKPTDQWITGFGWDQTRWPGDGFPSAAVLDETFPERPVYMTARSGHAAWVNSTALRIAGITRDTPDPQGARISRDENGEPDGLLLEDGAMLLVNQHIPEPLPEAIDSLLTLAMNRANRVGITGIHDVDGINAFKSFQRLHWRSELTLRVLKNLPADHLDAICESGLISGFGDDWLRIGGIKFFADGALGPRTAWMLAPYEGEPTNCGITTMQPAVMLEASLKASRAGLLSLIHAIGDRAVRSVLDIFEQVRSDEAMRGVTPQNMRHRIEHVQLVNPADRSRLAQMSIIASMQPIHAISDMDMADRYWGIRAESAYDWRGQLDEGAILALGSDAPIESIDPLPNIQAAVTRRRPDGSPNLEEWHGEGRRLTVEEAIHGFTIGPAYAAGMEDRTGRLMPGYLADLVVLDQDIFTCDPVQISKTEVLATMVGGKWVFSQLA